jgi:hypothetical protein
MLPGSIPFDKQDLGDTHSDMDSSGQILSVTQSESRVGLARRVSLLSERSLPYDFYLVKIILGLVIPIQVLQIRDHTQQRFWPKRLLQLYSDLFSVRKFPSDRMLRKR